MAIEVIAKIKQKNNGAFKLIDSCDVEMANGQDLQTYIEALELGEFPSLENLTNVVCVHDEELTEEQIEENEIFIDKSATIQEATNKVDNVFLEEIRSMFSSLQKTIDEQQKTIVDLAMRVKYLESLHTVVEPDDTTETVAILLENGGYLLTEDGGKLIVEGGSLEEVEVTEKILLEDGNILLLENGRSLLLESSDVEEALKEGITLEDGAYLLLENGSLLLTEGGSVSDETTKRLITETGNIFLLEDGGNVLLENSHIEIEDGEVVIKLESGGDLLLENGAKLLLELSDEEYALLLEDGKILLNEKNGQILLG